MSAYGPSLQLAQCSGMSETGGRSEVDGQLQNNANDPEQTFGHHFAPTAQHGG